MGGEALTPRVTVVVPVKNRADLLEALLRSLAAQTLGDHQVVVVDDGSTDGTVDVANAAAGHDNRVRVLSNPGSGAVAARTAGVAGSESTFIAFIDSDCVADARWLEAGVAALETGADVVQGRTEPVRPVRPGERSVATSEFDGLYATCNVFYRREAYERAGGFDANAGSRLGFRSTAALRGLGFGEDTLLGWRVAREGGAAFAGDAVVRHHVFPADLRESLRRAWLAGAFPALVREVPELRHTFLRHRYFLGDAQRAWLYASVALAALGRRRGSALGVGAWLLARGADVASAEPSRRRWPAATAHVCLADALTASALLVGSAKAKTPVL